MFRRAAWAALLGITFLIGAVVPAISAVAGGQIKAGRNVSTTLIHPGRQFKLAQSASIDRVWPGKMSRAFLLVLAAQGSERLVLGSAWRYVTECSGAGP